MGQLQESLGKIGAGIGLVGTLLGGGDVAAQHQDYRTPDTVATSTEQYDFENEQQTPAPIASFEAPYSVTNGETMRSETVTDVATTVSDGVYLGLSKAGLLEDTYTDHSAERLARLGAGLAVTKMIDTPLSRAAHEFGHFRHYSKYGMTNFAFTTDDGSFDGNPWTAYKMMFKNSWLGHETHPASLEDFSESIGSLPDREHLGFYVRSNMIGTNQEELLKESVVDDVLAGMAHVLDQSLYIAGAMGKPQYSVETDNSDLGQYIDNMDELGYEVTKTEIKATDLSKLMSNSTLSFIKANAEYMKDGETAVEPLSVEYNEAIGDKDVELYWPEFSSFLTKHGPSIKIEQRTEFDKTTLEPWYEQTTEGVHEIGFDVAIEINEDLTTALKTAYNIEEGGTRAEASTSYEITDYIDAGASAHLANDYSFDRQRLGNTPAHIQETEAGLSFQIEVSVPYSTE